MNFRSFVDRFRKHGSVGRFVDILGTVVVLGIGLMAAEGCSHKETTQEAAEAALAAAEQRDATSARIPTIKPMQERSPGETPTTDPTCGAPIAIASPRDAFLWLARNQPGYRIEGENRFSGADGKIFHTFSIAVALSESERSAKGTASNQVTVCFLESGGAQLPFRRGQPGTGPAAPGGIGGYPGGHDVPGGLSQGVAPPPPSSDDPALGDRQRARAKALEEAARRGGY